jgi:hypothetical protein
MLRNIESGQEMYSGSLFLLCNFSVSMKNVKSHQKSILKDVLWSQRVDDFKENGKISPT